MATTTGGEDTTSPTGPVLLDRDQELTDETCPLCDSPLAVRVQVGDDRSLECSDDDCGFRRKEPHAGEWSVFWIPRYVYDRFIWPVIRGRELWLYIAWVTVLMVWGLNHGAHRTVLGGTAYTAVLVFLAFRLLDIPPGRWCPGCGTAVGDDEFCGQCGQELDEPIRLVDEDDRINLGDVVGWSVTHIPYIERASVLDTKLVTEEHTQLARRLVDGRERAWRRLFDAGAVVGVAGVATGTVVAVLVAVAGWLAPGVLAVDPAAQVAPTDASVSLVGLAGGLAGFLVDLSAWASQPTVLLSGLAALVGLYVSLSLHELGHGIALELHGHDVDEYGIGLLLGVVPNYAWTKPGYNGDGERGLRSALHLATGGATLNLVTGGAVYAASYGLLWVTGYQPPSPLWWLVAGFVIISAVGVLNLVPFPGADGWHVVRYLAGWVGHRTAPLNVDHAMELAQVAVIAIWAAAFLGWLL